MSQQGHDEAETELSGGDPGKPEPGHGTDDGTLAGYFRLHSRPPAFEGQDGHPYTVSVESERVPDLRAPWEGFLVFPRWAQNGLGIVGHLETPTLWRGASPEEIERAAGGLTLRQVQDHLNIAIRNRADSART